MGRRGGLLLLIAVGAIAGALALRGYGRAEDIGLARAPASPARAPITAPVSVEAIPLRPPAGPCSGSFVARALDHVTTVPGDAVEMFEANGAGVAINDLDDDGDLDIVLANHAGANSILWNQGGLVFQMERMPYGDTRAVAIVDVDGDGRLDIVLTRRVGTVNYWRNLGAADGRPRFALEVLENVYKPAYAMGWGDLDRDGDLDLVTGSYDAELLNERGSGFIFSDEAGVYVYENREGVFTPLPLAKGAQALALALLDLNGDRAPDILIGNDFAVPDQAWARVDGMWREIFPFEEVSHSTMSLDWGDIDNDGDLDLFATDMKPYASDVATLAAWLPLMEAMREPELKDDPQVMENVLQVRDGRGRFHNEAYARGVDATGWSWSGKFGDLDNDGDLDLYVVNGMAEATLFHYLPDHELVEENQAFRNDGRGRFTPAPEWGLNVTYGGRGMSMADLDEDGDLDIVVNNLRGPALLLENRLCGGASLQVDLYWPRGGNTRAIGAELTLRTSAGTYLRDVRALSGYLSGDPARVHFGFPAGAELRALTVRWPDGAISEVARPRPGTRLRITRR